VSGPGKKRKNDHWNAKKKGENLETCCGCKKKTACNARWGRQNARVSKKKGEESRAITNLKKDEAVRPRKEREKKGNADCGGGDLGSISDRGNFLRNGQSRWKKKGRIVSYARRGKRVLRKSLAAEGGKGERSATREEIKVKEREQRSPETKRGKKTENGNRRNKRGGVPVTERPADEESKRESRSLVMERLAKTLRKSRQKGGGTQGKENGSYKEKKRRKRPYVW